MYGEQHFIATVTDRDIYGRTEESEAIDRTKIGRRTGR